MLPFPITVLSQQLAMAAMRSTAVRVTLLVAVGSVVATGVTEAQEATNPIDRLPPPLLERILDVADQPAHDSDGQEPQTVLSELDLDLLPHPSAPGTPSTVDLSELVLIPSMATVTWLDEQFATSVEPINSRIAFRQELLQELLSDPDSNDNRIRQVQSILSQLRAERDRIAIEHLLLVRQVSENGALPNQAARSGLE